jgi:hypothetical protein
MTSADSACAVTSAASAAALLSPVANRTAVRAAVQFMSALARSTHLSWAAVLAASKALRAVSRAVPATAPCAWPFALLMLKYSSAWTLAAWKVTPALATALQST